MAEKNETFDMAKLKETDPERYYEILSHGTPEGRQIEMPLQGFDGKSIQRYLRQSQPSSITSGLRPTPDNTGRRVSAYNPNDYDSGDDSNPTRYHDDHSE